MGSISKKITVQRKKDSNQADTLLKQLQAPPTKQKRSIFIEIFEWMNEALFNLGFDEVV